MLDQVQINNSIIHLIKDDITNLDIACFVYYATSDLKLGSGFGGAISTRGGLSVQKELDQYGTVEVGQAVISGAGELKANYIIHANGPKFQEDGMEEKLRTTMMNSLRLSDERGIKKIAFPPMGTGFYGVPLETSAGIMLDTIRTYLEGNTGIEVVIICVGDNREYEPFAKKLMALKG